MISIIHWILGVVFMLGLHAWTTRQFGPRGIWVTALVMVNVAFWYYYRRTSSELAFQAVMIWAVNVLASVPERGLGKALARAAIGGVLVGFLCVIRPVGVFVAAGFGVMLLIQAYRRRMSWPRCLVLGGIVAVVSVAITLGLIRRERAAVADLARPAATYLDRLRDPRVTLGAQVVEGFRLRVAEIGRMTLPGMFKSYDRPRIWWPNTAVIYLPAFIFVIFGWWRLARRGSDPLAWTFPFYLAMYIIWPFSQATRFMSPMLPVLWAGIWLALERRERLRAPIAAALICLHLGVSATYWCKDIQEARGMDHYWAEHDAIAAEVRQAPQAGALLALDRGVGFMLSFTLDRSCVTYKQLAEVPADVQWIVLPDKYAEVPGFVTRGHYGDIRLAFRAP